MIIVAKPFLKYKMAFYGLKMCIVLRSEDFSHILKKYSYSLETPSINCFLLDTYVQTFKNQLRTYSIKSILKKL